MCGCYDPVPRELPDVELVDCQDAVHLRHQLLLQGVHLDVCWHGLEEDQRGLDQQRPDGLEDEDDEDEGEAGVHVVFVLPVSLPHDHGGDDHDH